MPDITYLACPYTHPDREVRLARFQAVTRLASRLIAKGEVVYSPITHGHPIGEIGLPVDWQFWQQHSLAMLRACSGLLVYCLDGWDSSVGVREEVAAAQEWGIPVSFHLPEMEARLARQNVESQVLNP